MRLSSQRLREIVKEELRYFSEADDAGAVQGGDEQTDPAADKGPSKNVDKAEAKLKQYLSSALQKIKNEGEFRDVMELFLKMASAHPALTVSKVRLVLISLAKQVVEDAKQAKK